MEVNLKVGPKKTAIVSYGLRITIGGANSRAVGVEYLRKYFLEQLGRSQVDIVTYKLDSEKDIEFIKDIEDTNLNDYDEIIMHQISPSNVIGGVFKKEALQTLFQLADYRQDGELWYFFGDPKLFPSDYSKLLGYKRYGKPYLNSTGKINGTKQVIITDEWLNKLSHNVFDRTNVLFAGCDYELYKKVYYENRGKGLYVELGIRDLIDKTDWAYIPLYEYTNRAERLELKEKDYPWVGRKYDLVYYGNHRTGGRDSIINALYDHEELTNYVVGYDPEFKNCKYDFSKYVEHDEMFPTVASNAYATVIMGDTLHNNNIRTPRMYEALHMDVVAFIWHEYDENKKFIENEELRNFIYVNSYEDLKKKLDMIKNDEVLFRHIVELERKETIKDYEFAINKYKI